MRHVIGKHVNYARGREIPFSNSRHSALARGRNGLELRKNAPMVIDPGQKIARGYQPKPDQMHLTLK